MYRVLAYIAIAGFVAGGAIGENVAAFSNAGWVLFTVSFAYLMVYSAVAGDDA